jgi:hypothetical protein
MAIRKRSASADNVDRWYSFTLEIYPNLFGMFRERVIWDVGKISSKYERAISRAVPETVLKATRSPVPAENVLGLISDAVVDMGAALFRAAVNRTAWCFHHDDPAGVLIATEDVYGDVVRFARRRFKSDAAAVTELRAEWGPELEHALTLEWEKTKQLVQTWSDKLRSPAPPEENMQVPQRLARAMKGDELLLGKSRLVSFAAAETYLGINFRQRLNLIRNGSLQIESQGSN